MKAQIIERLGRTDVLLPTLIADGLLANDRIKVRLSVLQAAGRHAQKNNGEGFELPAECSAASIDPVAMENLVNRASLASHGQITAPGLGSLGAAIWNDVAIMIQPLKAVDGREGDAADKRLASIRHAASLGSSDSITPIELDALTRVADKRESLHRLVMDLHKALNGLSAVYSEEVIAGAHCYGLLPGDRATVTAFMRGVESTQKLKFGHPGLATTAMRSGARLTVQNDIGETDAHVVVIVIEQNAVTVTYTDIHPARVEFFMGLLRRFPIQWSGLDRKSEGFGEKGMFYLVTGRYLIENEANRNAFLETLGASLVFLIDWNKARKVLRNWVSKGDAVKILDWAARNHLGHRGFLELGGSEFLAAAVRHAAPNRIGFGEQLDRVLGREAAVDFLKTVLRISAEALLQGNSVRLTRDRVEAELIRHLQSVDSTLLAVVIRQVGLAREIAADIAHFLAERRRHCTFDVVALAKRARHSEEKADRIAMEVRSEIRRLAADRSIERLINQMEDAIDELEQAAFFVPLIPEDLALELADSLGGLCAAVVSATEAAAKGTAAAADVPEGQRVDSEDALAAIGHLIDAEHAADNAERNVTTDILTSGSDLKTALSVIELARALERATDRLAGFGHALRERVLADLAA